MTRESPLRVAFNKYRSKVKRLSCQENADIIQRYCKRVKERRDKAKDKQNTINITLAFEKLKKINPYKRYAFDKIKKAKQIDGLKKLIDYIIKKRLEILKEVLDNIKKGKKKKNKLLLKLLNIKKNFRDNLLKKYLKKWLEQNNKLKRKRASEIIQKNYKIFKNKKKKTGINEFLLRILKTKEHKVEDKYKTTLMKWLKNAKLKHANDAAKKIQNYLNKKTNNNRAKKNWRKLSILLFKKNGSNKTIDIILKLKNYFSISKFIHELKEKMRKLILKDLLKKLKLQKLLKLLQKILTDFSGKNKNNILKLYLNKWKDKANKLKKLQEILQKMVEDIDKRRKIIAAKTLNDVFLIKKLLHDILRVRALEFLKRLKNKGEYKKRLRALGDSLVRTKNDLDEKNKKIENFEKIISNDHTFFEEQIGNINKQFMAIEKDSVINKTFKTNINKNIADIESEIRQQNEIINKIKLDYDSYMNTFESKLNKYYENYRIESDKLIKIQEDIYTHIDLTDNKLLTKIKELSDYFNKEITLQQNEIENFEKYIMQEHSHFSDFFQEKLKGLEQNMNKNITFTDADNKQLKIITKNLKEENENLKVKINENINELNKFHNKKMILYLRF
jgi:hypothetical protein